jgi:WD40 repeat protein
VILWDVSRRSQQIALAGHADAVQAVKFSPDGRWLASGDRQGQVILWDTTTGRRLANISLSAALQQSPTTALEQATPAAGKAGITAIAISPDERVLALGTGSGYTQTFDLVRHQELTQAYQGGAVSDLVFASDNTSLLAATGLGDVARWRRAPSPPILLKGHQGQVRFAALDAQGCRAVTGGHDRQLCIWDVERQALVQALPNDGEAISVGALAPDGRRAATVGFGSGIVFPRWEHRRLG